MFYKYLRSNVKSINLPRAIVRDLAIRVLTFTRIANRFKINTNSSQVQSPLQTIKVTLHHHIEGKLPSVALFSHWEKSGELSDPDVQTISLLRRCGFQVIVVTTSASSLSSHDYFWERYSSSIDGLISRQNTGFDFGSWQEGLSVLKGKGIHFEELVLINNSLYPITEDISPAIKELRSRTDVGGLTWSNEFKRHIQSFFLYFGSNAVDSYEFYEFWNAAQALKEPGLGKRKVISGFELTWADYFSSNENLRVGAIFEAPSNSIRNPMTFHWKDLIASDFPFMKKSLFVQNYEKIDVSDWIDLVKERISPESVKAISNDIMVRKSLL